MAEESGFNSQQEQRISLLSTASILALEPSHLWLSLQRQSGQCV
jgi:hypothetical protein